MVVSLKNSAPEKSRIDGDNSLTLPQSPSREELRNQIQSKDLEAAAKLYNAMHGGLWGLGTEEDVVVQTLEENRENITRVREAYNEHYGRGLDDDILSEISEENFEKRAKALLRGERPIGSGENNEQVTPESSTTRNNAEMIRDNLDTWRIFQGREKVFEVLENLDPVSKSKISAELESLTGNSLNQLLENNLSQEEYLLARSLLNNGKLSQVEQLRYALEVQGGDIASYKKALGGLSKQQVDEVFRGYEERYKTNAQERARNLFSGRDAFEAEMVELGAATTSDEAMARLERHVEFEHSGLRSWIIDRITSKGEALRKTLETAKAVRKEMDENSGSTASLDKKLKRFLSYGQADVETYIDANETLGDLAGTAGATMAATGVIALSAGTATPLVAASLATAAGGAGYVVGRRSAIGQAYDIDDIYRDAALGSIEGVATVGSMGAAKVIAGAARSAFAETGKQVAVAAAASQGAAVAAEQVATSASRQVITRIAEGGVEGAIEGVISGGAGGAVRTGFEENTWKDGIGAGLSQMAQASIAEGVVGIAGGTVGSGLMSGVVARHASLAALDPHSPNSPGMLSFLERMEKGAEELRAGNFEAAHEAFVGGQTLGEIPEAYRETLHFRAAEARIALAEVAPTSIDIDVSAELVLREYREGSRTTCEITMGGSRELLSRFQSVYLNRAKNALGQLERGGNLSGSLRVAHHNLTQAAKVNSVVGDTQAYEEIMKGFAQVYDRMGVPDGTRWARGEFPQEALGPPTPHRNPSLDELARRASLLKAAERRYHPHYSPKLEADIVALQIGDPPLAINSNSYYFADDGAPDIGVTIERRVDETYRVRRPGEISYLTRYGLASTKNGEAILESGDKLLVTPRTVLTVGDPSHRATPAAGLSHARELITANDLDHASSLLMSVHLRADGFYGTSSAVKRDALLSSSEIAFQRLRTGGNVTENISAASRDLQNAFGIAIARGNQEIQDSIREQLIELYEIAGQPDVVNWLRSPEGRLATQLEPKIRPDFEALPDDAVLETLPDAEPRTQAAETARISLGKEIGKRLRPISPALMERIRNSAPGDSPILIGHDNSYLPRVTPNFSNGSISLERLESGNFRVRLLGDVNKADPEISYIKVDNSRHTLSDSAELKPGECIFLHGVTRLEIPGYTLSPNELARVPGIFKRKHRITVSAVTNQLNQSLEQLSEMGVELKPEGVRNGLSDYFRSDGSTASLPFREFIKGIETYRLGEDTLGNVKVNPKAGVLSPAITHPKFREMLAELKQKGYTVVADPSNGFIAEGWQDGSLKVIGIQPSSSMSTFLHEYTHARFQLEILESRGDVLVQLLIGEGVDSKVTENLLAANIQNASGFDVIKRLANSTLSDDAFQALRKHAPLHARAVELCRLGLDTTAVNENIAVEAELSALREAGYRVWSGTYRGTKDYGLHHRTNELSDIYFSDRTWTQEQTLRAAQFERVISTLWGRTGIPTGTTLGVAAAGTGMLYGYSEDLGEWIYKLGNDPWQHAPENWEEQAEAPKPASD